MEIEEEGDGMSKKSSKAKTKNVARRELVLKMKGGLSEINSFCYAVGKLSNDYDLEVEFG